MHIRRRPSIYLRPLIAGALCQNVCCGDDEIASLADPTDDISGGTGGNSTGGAPTTGDGPATDEPSNDLDCHTPVYPIPGAPFDIIGPKFFDFSTAEDCGKILLSAQNLSVTVYHPDPLPKAPLPVIVMTNGAGGQRAQFYGHILGPLAQMGFLAASVQSEGGVVQRSSEVACALRYLRRTWNIQNQILHPRQNPARFSCDLVLMGHSRGGAATYALGPALEDIPWADINPLGFDMNLRALIGIAPRLRLEDSGGYTPQKGVPYLAIQGSSDEDVPGHSIFAYDNMIRESAGTDNDPAKLLLWPYDVPHNDFGGFPGLDASKGQTLATAFIPAFLDLFIMGNEDMYEIFTGDLLPAGLDPNMGQWWSHIEPSFSELGEGPIIPRDFVVDQQKHPGSRQILENFENGGDFSSTLSPDRTQVGSQQDLTSPAFSAHHSSEVLKVRWGGIHPGGELTWGLAGGSGESLAEFSFFSLRVGQELVTSELDEECTLSAADPRRAAVTLALRLEDSQGNTAEVALGPIIQQDSRIAQSKLGSFCEPSQFMQTLRVPMDKLCQSGLDIASVVSLTLVLPDLAHEAGIFIDTLEFTRHPLDDGHLCP